MKNLLSFGVGIWLAGAIAGQAAESARTAFFKENLSKVPAPEMAAKAAELVKSASKKERESTTIGVIKAALSLRPGLAVAVVGAIAHEAPDMAGLATATAITELPKQSAAITRAAVAAAPSKAGSVVVAACRAVPIQYRDIAVAAAQAAPGSGTEILEAVESAIPSLKPAIQRVLAGYNGGAPSVAVVLSQASASSTTTTTTTASPSAPAVYSPMARGPAIGPPYIPLSGTPTNTVPGNFGEVPPGGRNYAAP